MIFSENYANGHREKCKLKIPFSPLLAPSATEACNAYTVMRFVLVIAQLHLFYAVTPD